jgi:hypothetical protein
VIGEAQDGRAALAAIARLHPDVVLRDVLLPDMDGFDTRVGAHNPDTCGELALLDDLCGSFVLVDQATEDRFSAYSALFGKIDDGGRWVWR